MMARAKKDQPSYSAGEKGRNRVRVFLTPKTGMIQMEWRENGSRLTKSLKHDDWEKAKRQADEFTVNYVRPEQRLEAEPEPEPLRLRKLFDNYESEETGKKAKTTQQHDRAAFEMFKRFFGADRLVESLGKRGWDRFIAARRSGQIAPLGNRNRRGVGARVIQQDLQLLRAVLTWAAETGLLPEGNPLAGKRLELPKEKNPLRVAITEAEYRALVEVAGDIDWRFQGMLILCHETGHRIGAVRQLLWSDIDLDAQTIRWRAETEKTGYGHLTPATDAAIAALKKVQATRAGIGNAPIFPADKKPSQPTDRFRPTKWWRKAEKAANLEPKKGRGWHSLRRKFASDLMHQPLKVLCELGGWKSPQTVLSCYQQPDEEQMRVALDARRRTANSGT
jgi:integrase